MFGPTIQNVAALAGRALLSAIFIMSGFSKAIGYAGTAAYMESKGVPGILLPLVILTELGGGLCILLGFQVRLAAIALAGFTLISALIFHNAPTDQINLLKNVAIAGGFLALFANGAGAYAVDSLLSKRA